MSDGDQWITFDDVVELVRARLDASIGRAEAATKAARASGEVRTRRRPIGGADPPLFTADDGLMSWTQRSGVAAPNIVTSDRNLLFSRGDLLDWLSRQAPQQPTPKTAAPASVRPNLTKVGAPERYDWDEIEQFVAKQLNEKGDYELAENKVAGWRTRADLIELTKDHLQKLKMDVPGDTQMKAKIGEFVERWRSIQKVGN
jgi:hypothetical protein